MKKLAIIFTVIFCVAVVSFSITSDAKGKVKDPANNSKTAHKKIFIVSSIYNSSVFVSWECPPYCPKGMK